MPPLLDHAVRDPNGRAYNRTAYLPERRKMMQQWADYLDVPAEDGKLRWTDVANAKTLSRLIQSVPSPKAEPIKLWLARVGV